MKKLVTVIVLTLLLLLSIAHADTLDTGNAIIEYDSIEDLQTVYTAVLERMVADYKTILFDAGTYDRATFIIGENFPAGRYYVYPVVVSDTDTDEYAKLCWWNADKVDEYFCSGYVCAKWCYTVELTDGMKIEFEWDGDQRGVCIAMQQAPDTPTNLMNLFD